jgi:hypothetical protein
MKPDAPPDTDVQLQIRMPLRLHDRLRRKAVKERRSLSMQARLLIAEGLKPVKAPQPSKAMKSAVASLRAIAAKRTGAEA